MDLLAKNKEMLAANLYNTADTRQMLKIDSLKEVNDYDLYLIACALCNYDIPEKSEARDLRMKYFLATNNGSIIGFEHSPSDYVKNIKTNINCKNNFTINKYGLYEYTIDVNNRDLAADLWSYKAKDCLKYVDNKTYADKIIVSVGKTQFNKFVSMLDELFINYDLDDLSSNNSIAYNNTSKNTLIDINKLDLPFTPYPFQLEDAEKIVKMKRALIGHEMGCITGNAIVTIKINNFIINTSLSELFELYKQQKDIKIKSFVDNGFTFMPIKSVLYKGKKQVIQITTSNTFIKCTLDHEILTSNGWIEAQHLHINDKIISNIIDDDIPHTETITNITILNREELVYDVAIDDFNVSNFIANHIVVHNCGKTFISVLVGSSIFNKEDVIYRALDNLEYNDTVITDKGPLPIGKIVEENIDCKVQVTKNGVTKFVNILDRRCVEE